MAADVRPQPELLLAFPKKKASRFARPLTLTTNSSLQLSWIALQVRRLLRRCRRRGPRRIGKVEEFRHVDLGSVPRAERLQSETFLDERQDRGVIRRTVRHVVLLGERRNHDHRHAETRPGEIPGRLY